MPSLYGLSWGKRHSLSEDWLYSRRLVVSSCLFHRKRVPAAAAASPVRRATGRDALSHWGPPRGAVAKSTTLTEEEN